MWLPCVATAAPSSTPTAAPSRHGCDVKSTFGDYVHVCDKSDGGICLRDATTYNLTTGKWDWKCGCRPGYYCTRDCDGTHQAHACSRTPAPTARPTTRTPL